MTTGKTVALTRWTFDGKIVSLLLNIFSRLFITFLPRSKRLLISWLQSPSAVILEPRKIKSATVSLSICHEVIGLDAMILFFKAMYSSELEKEMAIHSSAIAWKVPWTEEPGGPQSMGSLRVGHD